MASVPKWFDRVMETSTTTGTGTYTLAGAVTGYRAFSAVGDGNSAYYAAQAVDANGNPSGDWEVGLGTYASAGTTLTRDTILASSNAGAAVNWAAGTRRIFLVSPADVQTSGGLISQTGPANAAQTMDVGAMYEVDISGYTADRTYTLPAAAKRGDRCGITITAGDPDFELIITAASGDTLNGVAGGTEWSNLFITGETVIFRCVVANSAWIVEHDGRIPIQCVLRLSTDAASSESSNTITQPTSISGVWTADTDIGACAVTASGQIRARRAGTFDISMTGLSVVAVTDGQSFIVRLYLNGTTTFIFGATTVMAANTNGRIGPIAMAVPLAKDDLATYTFASSQGSRGLDSSTSPELRSAMTMTEVL